MTSHITEGAGTEVLPTAPDKGVVDSAFSSRAVRSALLRPLRVEGAPASRPEKEVPIQAGGNRVFARRTVHALRPDRAIAPHMNFANRADETALNHLDRAPQ